MNDETATGYPGSRPLATHLNDVGSRGVQSRGMHYHVLLERDRGQPIYFASIDAADDGEARRLVTERWTDERLRFVRQDGDRIVAVQPAAQAAT
jgi:hypothetical protein